MRNLFKSCEICGFSDWRISYQGKVRDGSFGNFSREDCLVARCSRCGADRLNEACCRDTAFYETEDYRHLINEPDNEAVSRARHNFLVVAGLVDCWPECLEGLSVAEIGCAGGHFLDQISGTAREVISIEPCSAYHESLRERGYSVYGFSNDAGPNCSGGIDFSFCFSVIEHVLNPRVFLEEARYLMSPGGVLVLSTPNRRDILMDLKEESYRSFFYRTVHRWYFDADSLAYCAREAGFRVIETHCVHRFGLSNAMAWLRDGRPTGMAHLPHLDGTELDDFWKEYLESRGVGDYLYIKLESEG